MEIKPHLLVGAVGYQYESRTMVEIRAVHTSRKLTVSLRTNLVNAPTRTMLNLMQVQHAFVPSILYYLLARFLVPSEVYTFEHLCLDP